MKEIKEYRLRKCSDIELEAPIFEVIDTNDVILMDITSSDNEIEILFHESINGKFIKYPHLESIICEVTKLLNEEE